MKKWKQRKSGRKQRIKKCFGASNGKASKEAMDDGYLKFAALLARA